MLRVRLLHVRACLQVSCIVIDSNLSVITKAAKGIVLKFALHCVFIADRRNGTLFEARYRRSPKIRIPLGEGKRAIRLDSV